MSQPTFEDAASAPIAAAPATRRARRTGEPRRVVVVASAAVVLAGLVAISVRTDPRSPVAPAVIAGGVAVQAESSAFYCGGLAHDKGAIESNVAIADLTGERHIVEVTTTNERGGVSLRQVLVTPGEVVHLSPASLAGGTFEAVSVVASGGGVAVSESIRGVNGTAVAPCLTKASKSWWLTGGSTTKNHNFVLSILNPYASAAVISVSLLTNSGVLVPKDLQGVVIGAHRLAALPMRTYAPGYYPMTAHVTASTGSVVVYGISRSTSGATSIGLLPGAPSLANEAWFPVGSSSTRITTQLLVVNPGSSPIDVTVPVWAPPGCGAHCPASFTATIGPSGSGLLTVSPATRVPSNRGMATAVLAGGAGLVVAQLVTGERSFGQNAPVLDPSRASGGRLVLVNPLATGFDDVGMVNPSDRAVTVSLATVGRAGPMPIGATYTIAPHDSLELGAGALRGMVGGLLVLVVDGPLVAAADVHGAVRGSSVLAAVPTD